jgi:hypothetical protein
MKLTAHQTYNKNTIKLIFFYLWEFVPLPSSMPDNAKLFLHKARDAPIAVLLRRTNKKKDWEMIRWDMETDTFTQGQWLMGKTMNGRYCQLSADGKYFAYNYDLYGESKQNPSGNWACHGVVSLVPNFTALYFCPNHMGNWEKIHFSEAGDVVFKDMEKKSEDAPPLIPWTKDMPLVPDSYVDVNSQEWRDPRGRVITTDGGKLLADGIVIYDCTDHVFEARPPMKN